MEGFFTKSSNTSPLFSILVICALQPKKGGSKEIVKQEREISEAEWIPVDEFLKVGSGEILIRILKLWPNFRAQHGLPESLSGRYQA